MDLPLPPANASASIFKSFISCVLAASVNSPRQSHVIESLSIGLMNHMAYDKITLKQYRVMEDKQVVVRLRFD